MVETKDLLTKIAQGDRIALSQLYDRYSQLIYEIAWKSLNSVEDCEEVVLEVFTQVWQTADRFDSEKSSGEQWILRITRSRIIEREARHQGGRLRKIKRLDANIFTSCTRCKIPTAELPNRSSIVS